MKSNPRLLDHYRAELSPIFRGRKFIPLLLTAITLAAFARLHTGEFLQWDDWGNLISDQRLNPPTLDGIAWYWTHPKAGLYIPVTYTVWGLIGFAGRLREADIWGCQLNPAIFHIANILVHALSVLAVFAVLKSLIRREWPACAGALLFGLHPVQVETVAWISGMKDLLCGLLSLLAIWQYLRYVETPGPSVPLRWRFRDLDAPAASQPAGRNAPKTVLSAKRYARLGHYLLATLAFVAAMLSKPTATFLPLVVFALDYWALKRRSRLVGRSLVLWVILAIPILVLARIVQDPQGIPYVPLYQRPLVVGDSLAFYLWKLVCPLWLAVDYGRRPAVLFTHTFAWLLWMIPLAMALWLYRWRRRRTWLVAAAITFVAPLIPTLGFVPFLFQFYSTVADHYLYLAMLGPALALARMAWRVPHPGIAIACAFLFGGLCVRSVNQEAYWKNDQTLWTHNLNCGQNGLFSKIENLGIPPRSFLAHVQLASVDIRFGNLPGARDHALAAAGFNPDFANAQKQCADVLALLSDAAGADSHGRELLRITRIIPMRGRSQSIETFLRVGELLARQGNDAAAAVYFREILRMNHQDRLSPVFPQAQMELDVCQGDLASACDDVRQLIVVNHHRSDIESLSTDTALDFLGRRLMNAGCYDAAIPCFEEEVRLHNALSCKDPTPGPADRLSDCRARLPQSKPPPASRSG